MRNVFAVIFLGLYGLALLRPILPMMDYAANKEFISTVLCLNKAQPELKCEGKCILAQKIAAAKGYPEENIPSNTQEIEHNLSLHVTSEKEEPQSQLRLIQFLDQSERLISQCSPRPSSPPPWS